MRINQFILENMEKILTEWVSFARSIQPNEMTLMDLRDHAGQMLVVIAKDMVTPQTEYERSEKSKGRKSRTDDDTAAETHADSRLNSGFSIELLAAEYRALRASVLKLWFAENKCTSAEEADDVIRFNEAIDQALAESIVRYSEAVILAQDIFLGVLGHDLRDPLNAVGTGAQMLMQSHEQNGRIASLGSLMYASVIRMTKMLDNLLNFTQTRIGGGLKFVIVHADLGAIANQVVAEFRLSQPNRVIHNKTDGDCTGDWDADRMSQVYQNLISNALQYGSVDIPVEISTTAFNDHVVFQVTNQGEPIPKQDQQRIFDLMQRVSPANAERNAKKNLGLGLYIVREIVVAHNGTITVESMLESGTTFTVTLPKLRVAAKTNN